MALSQLVRMIGSAKVSPSAVTVNGRTYAGGTPGAVQDVPVGDSEALASCGWMRMPGTVGPTANRPTTAPDQGVFQATVGKIYLDTSISSEIVFDGVAFRDAFTGVLV
jgi:hypothetical protein